MQRVLGLVLLVVGIVLSLVCGILLAVLLTMPGAAVEGIVITSVLLAIGLGMLLFAWKVLRRSGALTAGKDGEVIEGLHHRFVANSPEAAELLGREYTVFYQPPVKGKNGKPSLLQLRTPGPRGESFSIMRQNWFDRLAKTIGLATEIDAGDAEFDAECYIRTEAIAFTQEVVDDPANRRAIMELRRLGFTEIALRDGEFLANWSHFDPGKDDQADLLVAAAAHVLILSENLPRETPPAEESPPSRGPINVVLWVLTLGLAIQFLWVFWYKPVFAGELIGAAWPIVLPAYLVFAWLAGILLRGTSTSHDRWAWLAGVSLITFALGGTGVVAAANAMFDTGLPKLHQATVVDRRTTHSRSGTTYYLVCNSWRPGGDRVEFTVSLTEFNAVTLGQSYIEASTSPGCLGVEWIVSRHLVLQPRKK
jgi:hypothetical protein